MIRRPPRSTHCISSAASDVYKRQVSIVQEDQPPYLVKIGITNEGFFSLIPRLNQPWPSILKAITVSAPIWDGEIRGTKHGDWKPYFDARRLALENNADISLLIENDNLIDGDRCMPIILDADGTAYYPRVEEGALAVSYTHSPSPRD